MNSSRLLFSLLPLLLSSCLLSCDSQKEDPAPAKPETFGEPEKKDRIVDLENEFVILGGEAGEHPAFRIVNASSELADAVNRYSRAFGDFQVSSGTAEEKKTLKQAADRAFLANLEAHAKVWGTQEGGEGIARQYQALADRARTLFKE